jgi:hypothetical protein
MITSSKKPSNVKCKNRELFYEFPLEEEELLREGRRDFTTRVRIPLREGERRENKVM